MAWTSRSGKKTRSTMSRASDMIFPRSKKLWLRLCCFFFLQPIRIPTGPGGIGIRQTKTTDPVVFQPADIEVALVLPHRRDGRMRHAARVPERFLHIAIVVELDHASEIDAGAQPFIGRYLLHHASSKGGIGHRKVVDWRA